MGIEARRYGDVRVGDGKAARWIIAAPADARQIDLGPRMHVRLRGGGRSQFVAADKARRDSHGAARIAEQHSEIATRALARTQRQFSGPWGSVRPHYLIAGLVNVARQCQQKRECVPLRSSGDFPCVFAHRKSDAAIDAVWRQGRG